MSTERRVSRRKFIKGAAATFAAPYIITSTALGAEGRPAASNRITLGHIGIGNQGSGLLGAFLGNNADQVIAVADVNGEHRETARRRSEEKYKGVTPYNDYRELLARPDIDAVVIAVPDHWHAIISIDAAKAGKDIYCEKPLSLTIREAQMMRDAMRRYGRVFQTGSMQRSMREFQHACELVLNGRIGKIKQVNIGLPNNGKSSSEYGNKIIPDTPVPAGFDYDFWLGPAPWRPYNPERVSGDYGGGWRYVRDYSGGMMTDWGAHHFDIAQWGLGMDGNGPTEIYPPDGKDHPTLTYVYANGIPMMLGDANGVKFTGENGIIEVNRGYFKATPDVIGSKEMEARPNEISLNRGRFHYDDWLACIKTREKPICDVAIGASSATVCHLGNIAKWVGRPIKWNPQTEEIIGDDEASRWLDRPKRAPWHLP
ncbi:MAG: Gfo/Idh/MocA family oxidoreductase [Abitibacteriaceae bacterium]|nr:Gfo/Idh/MocA family oxidoreductase [Abditibacteriaceae bacterium]